MNLHLIWKPSTDAGMEHPSKYQTSDKVSMENFSCIVVETKHSMEICTIDTLIDRRRGELARKQKEHFEQISILGALPQRRI